MPLAVALLNYVTIREALPLSQIFFPTGKRRVRATHGRLARSEPCSKRYFFFPVIFTRPIRLRGGVPEWGEDAAAHVLEQPLRALAQGLGPATVLLSHLWERQSAVRAGRGGGWGGPGVLQRRLRRRRSSCPPGGGGGRPPAVCPHGGGAQKLFAANQTKLLRNRLQPCTVCMTTSTKYTWQAQELAISSIFVHCTI